MTFEEFKKAVIKAAEKLGIADYELYYTGEDSIEIEAFGSEISDFTSSVDGGISVRCALGGHMGYASTQSLSDEGAETLLRRAAENASQLETEEPPLFVSGGMTYENNPAPTYPLPDAQELRGTVLDFQERLLSSDPLVLNNSQSYASLRRSSLAIYNSHGLDVETSSEVTSIAVSAIVGDGGEMSNSTEIRTGNLKEIDRDEVVAKAVRDAKDKLGGTVPSTGVMPVVFSPEAVATLLSTFATDFSSESVQDGLSPLKDKEGERIAAETVTIVDDPFFEGAPIHMPFDAEGSPTHRKNIVENGILKTLLYNLQTAAKAGKSTTGNASKAGYAAKVRVRPFVMYIAPGKISEEELIKEAGNGVYINMLGGAHAGANAVSGDFSLQSAGFLIENGVKTSPIKSFTVSGNFFTVLNNITGIANNLNPPKRSGVTSFTSPSILVDGLTVAGK